MPKSADSEGSAGSEGSQGSAGAGRVIEMDARQAAVRLPLGDDLARLHGVGDFVLAEDPRVAARATVLGMMVLRPADRSWSALAGENGFASSLRMVSDWCYDVDGVGGSWPISASNPFDAFRLALQYGLMDAVMAGSRTVAREGVAAPSRRAHVWQPYTPLSWPALRAERTVLEPAIAAARRTWQQLGALSSRRFPAQIVVSASGGATGGDFLDAAIFHERHPDGSPIEAYVLTSEAGAARLRDRAKATGRSVDATFLVASPPHDDEAIDLARVPGLLRTRLDVRLAQHDGGAASLSAFLAAGAVAQLNLTLMQHRSVRDVLATSDRIDDRTRELVLGDWPKRARLFPETGRLPDAWIPFHAVEERRERSENEAVAVSFAVRDR